MKKKNRLYRTRSYVGGGAGPTEGLARSEEKTHHPETGSGGVRWLRLNILGSRTKMTILEAGGVGTLVTISTSSADRYFWIDKVPRDCAGGYTQDAVVPYTPCGHR